jgi:hypothetical protein
MRIAIMSVLSWALFAVCGTALAQPAAENDNLRDFDFVVEKITTNYAGYDTKVTDANRADLATLTARLRARAGAASDAELGALLTEWVGFFKDGHTRVFPIGAPAAAPGPAAPAPATPRVEWTEASVRAQFAALGRRRDPLEGIWRIDGERYRLAVLRTGATPDAFAAVVLSTTSESWKPGQVKADIKRGPDGAVSVTYRMGDHSERALTGELIADGVLLKLSDDLGAWSREWPAPRDPDIAARLFPTGELFLRRLSPGTLWLRIPDFDDSRAPVLKAALAAQADELATTPNLIIDLRNNGGGSDYVYGPLLPLIYTRPTITIGIELRASPDNIALRRGIIPQIQDSPGTVAQLEAQIALMEKNLGKYIQPDSEPFSIDRRDAVLPFPKRVAVLIDNAASTGEQFLLDARQSRKVTLMGKSNSAGVLDFANVVGMETPSGRFRVNWATSRSLRVPNDPVDPDGIAPDVRIPESEKDPVGFAQRWLERQVD